jgi:hypothetical protein
MAIPKIKATYSLDAETIRLLQRVSHRWGVSKSEALRRAIQASAAAPTAKSGRLAALDRLQKTVTLDAAATDSWARRARAERRSERQLNAARRKRT